MKFSKLLLAIGIVILGFWILGLAFKIAGWLIQVALVIGVVLVVAALLQQYSESHKKLDK